MARQTLKQKVEELERNNGYIANNVLDAIWVIDWDTMKFEYSTPSIERISGFTVAEYVKLIEGIRL